MLVLTRRSGESIVIGNDVRVRVLGTSGSRVRIGIEAPRDVRIVREKWPPQEADSPPQAETVRPRDDTPETPRAAVLSDRHTTLE